MTELDCPECGYGPLVVHELQGEDWASVECDECHAMVGIAHVEGALQ